MLGGTSRRDHQLLVFFDLLQPSTNARDLIMDHPRDGVRKKAEHRGILARFVCFVAIIVGRVCSGQCREADKMGRNRPMVMRADSIAASEAELEGGTLRSFLDVV